MQPERGATPLHAGLEVFRFECRYQLRSPLFAILGSMFFLLAFFAMASENFTIGGGTDNLTLNANFAILQTIAIITILSVLAVVAFVASPLLRDQDQHTLELLMATGISRGPYLLGRLAAGTLFATAVVLAALLGTLAGTFAPWLDPERLQPFTSGVWLYAIGEIIVPTMLVVCALFFAATCFWRSTMAGYLVAVALIIMLAVAGANTDAETIGITALVDPFGRIAFGEQLRYWTPAELETRVPSLSGTLLLNRVIWLGIALLAAIAGFLRYRLELPSSGGGATEHSDVRAAGTRAPVITQHLAGAGPALAQLASQLRMEAFGILRSAPIWVLLVFGVFNSVSGFFFATNQLYGTPVLPTTALMIDSILGTFSLMVLLALVYYAAELVSRERTHQVHELLDATPAAQWTRILAKLLAVWGIILAMYVVAAGSAAIVQLTKGFTDIRPGVYAASLFLQQGWGFMILAAAAVFLQVTIDRKFVGMFAVILLFLGLQTLSSLGFEHLLYTLGPMQPSYSDFYGFGHTLFPTLLTGAYWTAFTVLLIAGAHLLVRHGTDVGWRIRLASARTRMTRGVNVVMTVAMLAFIGLGAEIWRQTEVLTTFLSSDEIETQQAEYEVRYAQHRLAPAPQVIEMDVAANIYPEQRRFQASGHYLLENQTQAPIEALYLSMYPRLEVTRLEISGARATEADATMGWRSYRFEPALAPGAQVRLEFDITRAERGISPNNDFPRLASNGTFVDITHVLPLIGYDSGRELIDPEQRRDHDLPPVVRMPAYDDELARQVSAFGTSARTRFHTVVSTSDDQTAVAPGNLLRQWSEDGRNYFEYEMDAPIHPFVAWLSARYEHRTEQVGDVSVEVFFHPEHHWNVDAMIDASRVSLAYFEREFSPYQYDQYRIFEFPRYARFAQSFPNTIPFSEAIGFTADLEDPDNLDYVLFVTAHELAHQWWGHQVAGALVQGSTMLVETLAQYSALMVMEQQWGEEKMRRFLRYELDRYLGDRSGELVGELPLARVENQQYLHYRKGAIAMYALKDALGEAAVNRALRIFIERNAFGGAPFPRSGDLIALFRAEANAEQQELITDLFERIVLWDLAISEAEVTEVDGRWRVDATVTARKLEADARGTETEVPLDMAIDLAVFARSEGDLGRYELPRTLHRERQRITSGSQAFTFWVDEEPSRVGVDPFSRLIDRVPADNIRTL